jgi:NAD(P)-dependent dehydrogenase (short-subunit alcohol dehydrogenase family)
MTGFEDKVVLVTGAAGGFGRLLATRLAEAGARLALADIDEPGVAAVADRLGREVLAEACDVAVEKQVANFVAKAVDRFGRLDVAINNAGISTPMKSLVDTTEEDLDRNFAVNAKGVFFGMKYQVPVMLKQGGGSILNVASMAGINGAPKLAAYAAAKHAVVGLTKTAAVEFARKNVRVNAVCPYFSPTPLVTRGIDPEVQDMVANASPMKRLGTPEEIVETMLHIVSPDNAYLTGQVIAIDGGVSAI